MIMEITKKQALDIQKILYKHKSFLEVFKKYPHLRNDKWNTTELIKQKCKKMGVDLPKLRSWYLEDKDEIEQIKTAFIEGSGKLVKERFPQYFGHLKDTSAYTAVRRILKLSGMEIPNIVKKPFAISKEDAQRMKEIIKTTGSLNKVWEEFPEHDKQGKHRVQRIRRLAEKAGVPLPPLNHVDRFNKTEILQMKRIVEKDGFGALAEHFNLFKNKGYNYIYITAKRLFRKYGVTIDLSKRGF